MHVVECDVPSGSALGKDAISKAYFHDSYRVPLVRPGLTIVEIFFALFGHAPRWMKALLITRNAIARCFKLEAPTVAEILKPAVRTRALATRSVLGRFSSLAIMRSSRAATTSTLTSGSRCSG